MISAMRGPTVVDATQEIMSRIERIERALERLPEGPERGTLAGDVTALREALQWREGLERDERHQLGHDLRVPLNAIAGWTHITSGSTRRPRARWRGPWTSSTGRCGR